jgi:excinuclease ABC subunit A
MSNTIDLSWVTTHNLRDVDISFTKNSLTVITGVSWSGKSSLAFTTLCNEGQRRYLESLSTYARMFIGGMSEEAKVKEIRGLTPTISIEQKTVAHNPRSTVGTITEIYDFYRLLFLTLGVRVCPHDGTPMTKRTHQDVMDYLRTQKTGTRVGICSQIRQKFESPLDLREFVGQKWFVRYLVDNHVYNLSDALPEEISDPWIVVDRVELDPEDATQADRLSQSISTAFEHGEDVVGIYIFDEGWTSTKDKVQKTKWKNLSQNSIEIFSRTFRCPLCGNVPETLTLSHFSFNSPTGACPDCHGLGSLLNFTEDSTIDPDKTVENGCVMPWSQDSYYYFVLQGACRHHRIPLDVTYKKLSEAHKNIILHGSEAKLSLSTPQMQKPWNAKYPGVIPYLNRVYHDPDTSESLHEKIDPFVVSSTCSTCHGYRVGDAARSVLIEWRHIGQVAELSVEQSIDFFDTLTLDKESTKIAGNILKNVRDRLKFLKGVGLGYMTLARRSNTLSGGESQRIRLATQVGTRLEWITYVLDEPSIGLHPRDSRLLLDNLRELVNLGNTVIVVEHDEDIMGNADEIIDIGPWAGVHGGTVVFQWTYAQLLKSDTSTARFLRGEDEIRIPELAKKPTRFLELKGATENNLKNVSVKIPLEALTVVTGVSGSGKSSLINRTLAPVMHNLMARTRDTHGPFKSISGHEHLDKVVIIDQMPIGKTPRSNPATYTGVFTDIRDVFAQTLEARARGYKAGHFSFNTKQGRCDACEGDGVRRIQMHFLPDVHVTCESCGGTRYNHLVREIHFHDKSIADILAMTVEDAVVFFDKFPKIKHKLQTLFEVGLGYITLGQSALTLSGGESQRIKLATELARKSTGKTLYIMDEPTTGLHFSDIQKLMSIVSSLVEKKNTVLIIEHHLDVIANAHYIIDMGPEGGERGGNLLYEWPREGLLSVKWSYTADCLKQFIDHKKSLKKKK